MEIYTLRFDEIITVSAPRVCTMSRVSQSTQKCCQNKLSTQNARSLILTHQFVTLTYCLHNLFKKHNRYA